MGRWGRGQVFEGIMVGAQEVMKRAWTGWACPRHLRGDTEMKVLSLKFDGELVGMGGFNDDMTHEDGFLHASAFLLKHEFFSLFIDGKTDTLLVVQMLIMIDFCGTK